MLPRWAADSMYPVRATAFTISLNQGCETRTMTDLDPEANVDQSRAPAQHALPQIQASRPSGLLRYLI